MARRTRKAGMVARFGPRYGVRIRRRVQEIEEGLKHRHACPRCAAIAVRRASTGVWKCRRCGYVFAGGAYRPIVTTSFKREVEEAGKEAEPKPEDA
ncbi:MAG: 50S ribosomal protein L37ae [Methanobacteriota archaeon]|nr:MAG: 50S ribosomal protein L37ae [Euryarchaeota archaeon]